MHVCMKPLGCCQKLSRLLICIMLTYTWDLASLSMRTKGLLQICFHWVTGSSSLVTREATTRENFFAWHCQFLGFSFFYAGQLRSFQFMFFLFGLLTGPQLFTKIQQTLVKYWVAKGFHIFTYLDDGAGANQI